MQGDVLGRGVRLLGHKVDAVDPAAGRVVLHRTPPGAAGARDRDAARVGRQLADDIEVGRRAAADVEHVIAADVGDLEQGIGGAFGLDLRRRRSGGAGWRRGRDLDLRLFRLGLWRRRRVDGGGQERRRRICLRCGLAGCGRRRRRRGSNGFGRVLEPRRRTCERGRRLGGSGLWNALGEHARQRQQGRGLNRRGCGDRNRGGAGVSVRGAPAEIPALADDAHALGLGVEPAEPLVAELVAGDPPAAGIDGGAEVPGEIAGFAREAAFRGVADGQLGAGRRVDLHRGAGDELADLRSGQPRRRLRPGRGCRGKQQSPRKDHLEH